MEQEGTLVREYGSKPTGKPSPGDINYNLYFKGLVREETTGLLAGFGVAICRQEDNNLLFQMKESLHDSEITVLEAELTALKRGLTEAVGLGITHISIYCDQLQIYELVMGRSASEQENISLQRIRQQMTPSIPVLVTRNQVKFAYKLAMETVVSEISISMPPAQKKTCCICFGDDFEAEQMFSVALCGHQFCVECVKQHIKVGLLEGSVMRCLHYRCESKLTLTCCANLLTPKLRERWERRIEEEYIPVADRVYCPKPWCSALMSETELSKSTGEDGVRRCCVKCAEPFCINCKVPWHSNLSCDDYKRLGPNPTKNDIKQNVLANEKMWRQCGKCKHMIELSYGCIHVTCRCGYSFCYTCGAQWKEGGCPHRQRILADACYACKIMTLVFFFVVVFILVFVLIFG